MSRITIGQKRCNLAQKYIQLNVEIVRELIDRGKITIIKKEKDGVYGATLATIQEAEVVE